MSLRYPLLWTRLYNAPLMIRQEKAEIIEQVFRSLPAVAQTFTIAQESEFAQPHRSASMATLKLRKNTDKPYLLTESGIAIIPVLGTLIQRGDFFSAMSGMASYDRIGSLVVRSEEDPEVRGRLMEIDTYGGEAAGMIDLADLIFASSERKPLWAHVNESAYSAGYGLASAAAKVHVARGGGVGSIGTIAMHIDQSKYDEKQGKHYTFVYAGDRKKDFNSHEPLSEAALETLQEEVDRANDLFIESVAVKRDISSDKVRNTQAALMSPAQALEGKFIDGIATFAETVSLLEAELASRVASSQPAGRFFNAPQEEMQMEKQNQPAGNQNADKQFTQADVDQARAEGQTAGKAEGEKAGEAKGRADGVKAERERIGAILGGEEAKGRANLALHLALQTDSDAVAAKKLLAAASKETGTQAFGEAMSRLANPNVGTDTNLQNASDAPKVASSAEIFAARKQQVAATVAAGNAR